MTFHTHECLLTTLEDGDAVTLCTFCDEMAAGFIIEMVREALLAGSLGCRCFLLFCEDCFNLLLKALDRSLFLSQLSLSFF